MGSFNILFLEKISYLDLVKELKFAQLVDIATNYEQLVLIYHQKIFIY